MTHADKTMIRNSITKIGLAVTNDSRILLVRKRGAHRYILPGGKPERGEGDLETLQREIHEELGCNLEPASIRFLGTFTDISADAASTEVTVRLYRGALVGQPTPKAEIEVMRWIGPDEEESNLAPSLRNQILPFLFGPRTT